MSEDSSSPTPYERIGGDAAVRALVDRFYDLMELDARFAHLRSLHPERLEGSRDKLRKFCSCVGDLVQSGGIPFSKERVADYFTEVAAGGYPAVHHSKAYRDAYRPAYRVVSLEFLPLLGARR